MKKTDVELAMSHEDKLNDEGKIQLAESIINRMTEEELNDFLKLWGYKK